MRGIGGREAAVRRIIHEVVFHSFHLYLYSLLPIDSDRFFLRDTVRCCRYRRQRSRRCAGFRMRSIFSGNSSRRSGFRRPNTARRWAPRGIAAPKPDPISCSPSGDKHYGGCGGCGVSMSGGHFGGFVFSKMDTVVKYTQLGQVRIWRIW